MTWSINSICHFFGRRRFETDDHSTNVFWLALPSLGEAWHHNHHAFPRSAFHGLRWYELDPSGWLILGMERVGLAWDVVKVSPERARAKLADPSVSLSLDMEKGAQRAATPVAPVGAPRATVSDMTTAGVQDGGVANVKPRLRGVSHEYAFFVSIACGVALILAASDARARVAAVDLRRRASRRCSARARSTTASPGARARGAGCAASTTR